MRRITFQNSRNQTLVGRWYCVGSKAIIIMAHGFLGEKSSRGRFDKLASTFNKTGFDVLTFDFSGCGESDDEYLTIDHEVDDLQSAIRFAKSKGYLRIALYGHSLGSLICLKSYTEEIVTMVFSGALTGPIRYNYEQHLTEDEMQELENEGHLTKTIGEIHRRKMIVDRQLFIDIENINQKELFNNIKCAVLIIHGNKDQEERDLLERSKKAMQYLPKESRLEVIEGATHQFFEHIHIVIDLVNNWFIAHLER